MSNHNENVDWSIITDDEDDVLRRLQRLTTSQEALAQQGYVFSPLTEQQIQAKNRCSYCAKPLPKITQCPVQPPFTSFQQRQQWLAHEERQQEKQRCVYHHGTQWAGKWKCCGQHMYAPGCCEDDHHEPCDINEIRADWQFERTPHSSILDAEVYRTLGIMGSPPDYRRAVALDCEMGTSVIGTSPLIKLCVVDFMTGETLINQYVIPDMDMLHYNTKFSGVTYKDMRVARSTPGTFWGTDEARAALLNYIHPNTFIIMHSGQNDLTALRLIHPATKIIDTFTLESNDPSVEQGVKKSLKDVCARRCNIAIQCTRLPNGQLAGHDPLEDAMAAREIVCSWLRDMEDSDVDESEESERAESEDHQYSDDDDEYYHSDTEDSVEGGHAANQGPAAYPGGVYPIILGSSLIITHLRR